MSNFTIRQLECFIAVVQAGSLTIAAEQLHASPGAISLALKELEDSVKTPLTIRRRGKGTILTPAGRLAYRHALDLMEQTRLISNIGGELRGELTGDLRLGCFSTLSPWMVPRIIGHFSEHYPGVDVYLQEGDSAELQNALHAGDLDAVIMYRNALSPKTASQEVAPVRLQIAIAANHPLAPLEAIPLSALQNEPAILVGLPAASAHVEEILRAAGLEPNVRWRSTNIETIRSMVARGLGYTIIMGRPYGDQTYDGLELAYRRIEDDVPANSVVIGYPKDVPPSAKVRALISFCEREFSREGRPVQ